MPSKKRTGWAEHQWRRILPFCSNGWQLREEINQLAMNFHRDDSKSSHLIPPPSYIGQHPPYTAHVFRNYFLQADPQNFCGTRRVYKLGRPCAVKQQKTFHSICMLNYYPRRICVREQGERQWYSINVLHLCKCKPSLSL